MAACCGASSCGNTCKSVAKILIWPSSAATHYCLHMHRFSLCAIESMVFRAFNKVLQFALMKTPKAIWISSYWRSHCEHKIPPSELSTFINFALFSHRIMVLTAIHSHKTESFDHSANGHASSRNTSVNYPFGHRHRYRSIHNRWTLPIFPFQSAVDYATTWHSIIDSIRQLDENDTNDVIEAISNSSFFWKLIRIFVYIVDCL